jgi:biopolymer transport protein ExbD
MLLKKIRNATGYLEFNITAIIDIIFILIIFLLFLGQFIARENIEIAVPEEISNSLRDEGDAPNEMILSVKKDEVTGDVMCYLKSVQLDITLEEVPQLAVASMINKQLELATENQVVNLRMDKELVYREFEPIIAGIAASNIKNMIISGLQEAAEKQPETNPSPAAP